MHRRPRPPGIIASVGSAMGPCIAVDAVDFKSVDVGGSP
jgi:hypothetical protein